MKLSVAHQNSRGPQPWRTWLSCWLLALAGPGSLFAQTAAPIPADVLARHQVADADFARESSALAEWATGQGLAELNREILAWTEFRDPDLLYFPKLPEEAPALPAETDTSPAAEGARRFLKLRKDYAERLFGLAHEAARARRPNWASEWTWETLRQNPDHPGARQALGYVQDEGRWRTPFEVRQRKAGQIWNDRFGWVRASQQEQWRSGQRLHNRKWISAEEDAQLHKDIEQGWKVPTEHYEVLTNHSLEAGVLLGARLEELHRVWEHVFISYLTPPSETTTLAETLKVSTPGTFRHSVVYFSTREEYNRRLQGLAFGDVTKSTGFYMSDELKSFFFNGPEQDGTTLVHEAVHQLLSETLPAVRINGQKPNWWASRKSNFWIIEGIACYFESYVDRGNFYTLGGFDNDRMRAARYHLFKEAPFYLPLEELTSLDMKKFQQHPDVVKLYSQGTGLTSFLMHYDHGRYREALMAYLREIYHGRDQRLSLARLTGQPFDQLDREYRDYCLQSLRRDAE